MQAVNVVHKNHSFQSYSLDNVYRKLFLDSDIFKSYKMSSTGVMHFPRHQVF